MPGVVFGVVEELVPRLLAALQSVSSGSMRRNVTSVPPCAGDAAQDAGQELSVAPPAGDGDEYALGGVYVPARGLSA